MKKVAVVTGTRAEYGVMSLLLGEIESSNNLELLLVVTGMHLSREFGYTVEEIERDGFKINARVEMLPENDSLAAMAASVGKGIIGMVRAWEQLRPDIILVLGDRAEALAGAVSGAYMNIPVAHIHGGDACTGGNIDDANRFAITKFAHIHFPATAKSARRILKLGEEKWRIHCVGSPALDAILNEPLLTDTEVAEKFGLDISRQFILVIQHPVTVQVEKAGEQIRETLEAVIEFGYPAVVIYPNSDAGGRKMIAVVNEYEKNPLIKTYKSLPRKEYLSLMKIASVMVGNSSSAIIDAPSFGLPAVNIGIRQEGRERGNNIIDAEHKKADIIQAIEKAINDKAFIDEAKKCENPYGDGKASNRITEILSDIEITSKLLQKKVTY